MLELINPSLDTGIVARELRNAGLAVIRDFLPRQSADQLLRHLEKDVAWDLAYSDHGEGRTLTAQTLERLTPAQIREAVDPAFREREGEFRFIYNTMRVIESWQAKEYATHPLYAFAETLHQPRNLQYFRDLSGNERIQRLSVMAARYLPGHFLTPHDDFHAHEGREVTWILNLTRDWKPEWGGLLHVMNAKGDRIDYSLIPAFNTMVLFIPPRPHFVSQVANFARLPRHTLTGWMLST